MNRVEEEAAGRADDLRQQLGLGTKPIPDIVTLLEGRGLKVFALRLGLDSPWGMYVPRPSHRIVLLNTSLRDTQLRVAAAHELAHDVFGDGAHLDDGGTIPSDGADTGSNAAYAARVERRANAFARGFLLPRGALREAFGPPDVDPERVTADRAFELACRYMISYRHVTTQLYRMDWIDGHRRRSLDADRGKHLASELRRPAQLQRTYPIEYLNRALRAYARHKITFDRLAQFLHWDDDDEHESLRQVLRESRLLHHDDAALGPHVTSRRSDNPGEPALSAR